MTLNIYNVYLQRKQLAMSINRVLLVTLLSASSALAQETNDPFPEPISSTDGVIQVNFSEFASVPDIDGQPARMMLLSDEPGTGRLFVNDMRGQGHEITLIVGADVADGLETWERSDQLRQLVRVAIVDRPGYVSSTRDGWLMERVTIEPKDISSSELRDQMSEGVSIYDSLSASVRRYIDDHQLEWASHDK